MNGEKCSENPLIIHHRTHVGFRQAYVHTKSTFLWGEKKQPLHSKVLHVVFFLCPEFVAKFELEFIGLEYMTQPLSV